MKSYRNNYAKLYKNNNTLDLISKEIPSVSLFKSYEGEFIIKTNQRYFSSSLEDIFLDEIDTAIIEEVARSKYITSLQLYQYISLRGIRISRPSIRKRLVRLIKHRMIMEKQLIRPEVEYSSHNIRFYEIDYNGFMYLRDFFYFHKGNLYISYRKKESEGLIETANDVKRVLVGNQIIISLLLAKAKIQRFGFMETFRTDQEDPIMDSCIFRTALNVKLDEHSILAYEIVRDTPESYEKIADKVKRYYAILKKKQYLTNNYFEESAYPQLIICGEDRNHNQKIMDYLKQHNCYDEKDPILFTEDILASYIDPLQSLYSIQEDSLLWYQIPKSMETVA